MLFPLECTEDETQPTDQIGKQSKTDSMERITETNNKAQERTPRQAANTEDACLASGENVLLQTATTNVKNPQSNRSVKARVLLDPGSHRTYVTKKLANRLELKRLEKEIISVVTFGSTKPKQIESRIVSIELPLKDGTHLTY